MSPDGAVTVRFGPGEAAPHSVVAFDMNPTVPAYNLRFSRSFGRPTGISAVKGTLRTGVVSVRYDPGALPRDAKEADIGLAVNTAGQPGWEYVQPLRVDTVRHVVTARMPYFSNVVTVIGDALGLAKALAGAIVDAGADIAGSAVGVPPKLECGRPDLHAKVTTSGFLRACVAHDPAPADPNAGPADGLSTPSPGMGMVSAPASDG